MTLQEAIAGSAPNSIINLGDEPMGAVTLSKLDGRGVTLRGGWFDSIYTSACANITFDFDGRGVRFTPDETTRSTTSAIKAWQSKGLRFGNGSITGGPAVNGVAPEADKLDATGNVMGLPAGRALYAYAGGDIVTENLNIEQFHRGLIFDRCPNVITRRVNTASLRTTPFTFVSASDWLMEYCSHAGSTPWKYGGAGDHGDFVHTWADPGDPPMEWLRIRNNSFIQGVGALMMGIYLQDKSAGYRECEITGNLIHQAHRQGILVQGMVGGRIAANTLAWSGDMTAPVNAKQPGGVWPDEGKARYHNAPVVLVTGDSRDIEFAGEQPVDLYKLTPEQEASMRFIRPANDDPALADLLAAIDRWKAT